MVSFGVPKSQYIQEDESILYSYRILQNLNSWLCITGYALLSVSQGNPKVRDSLRLNGFLSANMFFKTSKRHWSRILPQMCPLAHHPSVITERQDTFLVIITLSIGRSPQSVGYLSKHLTTCNKWVGKILRSGCCHSNLVIELIQAPLR